VDNNVTRHLETELALNDWDVTILHYLGLDHIGHLAGPASPLVPGKLDEMSAVLKNISNALASKPWKDGLPPLVLVLGDHGMSDAGSHGGASVSEVMTPIVALGPAVAVSSGKIDLVDQQDLASTLAFLTGVPIPKNNLGALIPKLVMLGRSERREEEELAAWYYNAEQVAEVLQANLGPTDAVKSKTLLQIFE
jgi:ethanolaminephosphotransferase